MSVLAGKKISSMTAIAGASLASADLLAVVDFDLLITKRTTLADLTMYLNTNLGPNLQLGNTVGGVNGSLSLWDNENDAAITLSSLSDAGGNALGVSGNATLNLGGALILGKGAGQLSGQLKLTGTTSGTVTVKPADAAGTWTLTLPTDDGTPGQFLQTNGSGVSSWASVSAVPTVITVANEATDTTSYLAFFTGPTGDLGPKTNANATFNSATGVPTFAAGLTTLATGLTLTGPTNRVVSLALGNFDNTAGVWTLAQAAGTFANLDASAAQTFAGPLNVTTSLLPTLDDALTLGSASKRISDTYLASGHVTTYGTADYTVTHSTGNLSFSSNVGVGASAPLAKVHILAVSADPAANGPEHLRISTGQAVSSPMIRFGINTAGTSYGFLQAIEPTVAFRNLCLNPGGGNVGIATTAPGAQLETANYLRVTGSANAATGSPSATNGVKGVEITYDSTADIGYIQAFNRATSAYKRLEFGGSTVTVSNGNFGVGVVPTYRVDIATAVANDRGINIAVTSTSGTSYGGVAIVSGAATTNVGWYLLVSGATNNKAIEIQGPSAGTSNYAIYSAATAKSLLTGSLGIGGDPQTGVALDVCSVGVAISGTVKVNSSFTQDHSNYRGVILGYDSSGQIGVIAPSTPSGASSLAFWTYSGSAWGERLRIDGTGKLLFPTGAVFDYGTADYTVTHSTGLLTFGGKVTVTGGSLASTTQALSVTGTMSNVNAAQTGVAVSITPAGSALQTQFAMSTTLQAGYTGASYTIASFVENKCLGTGGGSLTGAAANYGLYNQCSGVTSGQNIAVMGVAQNSTANNFGVIGFCNTGGAVNVGTIGLAYAGSTARIGGLFAINSGTGIGPTLGTTSAALICDNMAAASAIFLARDNGSDVFAIADGGNVGVGVTPSYKLDILTSAANDRGINIAVTSTSGTVYGGNISVSGAATTNVGLSLAVSGATNNRGLEITGPAAGANNYAIYSTAAAQSLLSGNLTVKSGTAGFVFDAANQYIGTTFGSGGGLSIYGEAVGSATGAVWQTGGSTRGDASRSAHIFYSNSVERLRVDGDFTGHTIGRVGVNVSLPRAQLHVNPGSDSTVVLLINGAVSQSADLTQWQKNDETVYLSVGATGNLSFGEGVNVVSGTSTGTKIGTATTQKIGLWNATPVTQQTVTGSKVSGAALADLLTKLALTGIIVDGTSA